MDKYFKMGFVLSSLLLLSTPFKNCAKYSAKASRSEKTVYLQKNSIFAEAVQSFNSDGGSAVWLDSQNFDEGSGFTYVDLDTGLPIANPNEVDGGSGQELIHELPTRSNTVGGNSTHNRTEDSREPSSIGVVYPTIGENESPLLGTTLDSNGLPRVLVCINEQQEPGYRFLDELENTYSQCQPCAIVDRINARCLREAISVNYLAIEWPSDSETLPIAPPIGPGFFLFADTSTPTKSVAYHDGSGNITVNNNNVSTEACVDPLVIDLLEHEERTTGLEMSNVEAGVNFDIRGIRATPIPHTLNRVSWIKNPRFAFLVLPNSRGFVEGIDQLFGDNTLGPDGKFSAEGFQALAKYDGTDVSGKIQLNDKDGYIDMNDPIFKRLHVWSDVNFDGVAEKKELRTLEQVNIEYIDLNFDPNFYEKDKFGNQIVFKSIVGFTNGRKSTIFDLWIKARAKRDLDEILMAASHPRYNITYLYAEPSACQGP